MGEDGGAWKGWSEDLKDFRCGLDAQGQLWNTVDVRIVAFEQEDSYRNLETRCYLTPRRAENVEQLAPLPDVERLLVKRVQKEYQTLDDLLRQFQDGELRLDDNRITYWRQKRKERRSYRFSYHFEPRSTAHPSSYTRSAAHVLSGSGGRVDKIIPSD